MQNLALTEAVAEAHHLWLLFRMGFTQLGCVANTGEMTHHAPAPAKTFTELMQARHQLIPAQR